MFLFLVLFGGHLAEDEADVVEGSYLAVLLLCCFALFFCFAVLKGLPFGKAGKHIFDCSSSFVSNLTRFVKAKLLSQFR